MSREAMQMALEALESDPVSHLGLVHRKLAITALRQALVNADDTSEKRVDETAKQEHEPVAWFSTSPDGKLSNKFACKPSGKYRNRATTERTKLKEKNT